MSKHALRQVTTLVIITLLFVSLTGSPAFASRGPTPPPPPPGVTVSGNFSAAEAVSMSPVPLDNAASESLLAQVADHTP